MLLHISSVQSKFINLQVSSLFVVLQITMLSRNEHSLTTLLPVGEPRNNSENYIFTFQPSALNHYTNPCMRVDIYRRGIDYTLVTIGQKMFLLEYYINTNCFLLLAVIIE